MAMEEALNEEKEFDKIFLRYARLNPRKKWGQWGHYSIPRSKYKPFLEELDALEKRLVDRTTT